MVRIEELQLRRFGHFRDVTLRFDRSERTDLQLLYGDNEAGKSTTLRAFEYLLFGFPHQISDDFLFPSTTLRLAATLTDGEARLAFVRRKGKKHTLRDREDDKPLDDVLLPQLLGGLERHEFRNRFGLSHQRLVEGGRALIEGGGEVGEALFAAESGIAGLQKIRKELDDDARKLFLKGGRKQKITQQLSTIQEFKSQLQKELIPAAKLQEEQDNHSRASERRGTLNAQLAALQNEWNKTDRSRRIRRHALSRAALLEQLEPYRSVPLLDDDFSERRINLEQKRAVNREHVDRFQLKSDSLRQQRDAIQLDANILAHRDQIESIRQQYGAFEKAAGDARELASRVSAHDVLIADKLEALGEAVQSGTTGLPVISTAQRQLIRTLLEDGTAIQADVRRCREEIEQKQNATQKLQARRDQQGDILDCRPLESVLRSIGNPLQIAEELEELLSQRRQQQKQLQQRLAQLPKWTGTLEELIGRSLPLPSTIDRFAADLATVDTQLAETEAQIKETERRCQELREQVARQSQGAAVPTLEALERARSERDRLWQLLRRIRRADVTPSYQQESVGPLFDNAEPDADIEGILQELDVKSSEELEDRFQHAVLQADSIADRLRNEADAAARLQHDIAERDERLAHLERLHEQLGDLQQHRKALLQQWQQEWDSQKLPAILPSEAAQWRAACEAIVERADESEQLETRISQLQAKQEDLRRQLAEALGDEDGLADDGNLSQLVDRAEAKRHAMQAHNQSLAKTDAQIEQLQAQIAERESELHTAESKLADWNQEWQKRIGEVGLSGMENPKQSRHRIGLLEELWDIHDERRGLQRRLTDIESDAERFKASVAKLARQLVPECADDDVGACVSALTRRLDEEREARQNHEALSKQLAECEQQLTQYQQELSSAEIALQTLVHEAGCEESDQLSAIEQQSRTRRELESKRRECEQLILESASGEPLETVVAEALEQESHTLEETAERLKREIESLETQRQEADREVGACEERIRRFDSSDEAARIREECNAHVAELAEDVQGWCRLRMASALLDETINRYRQRATGPLLARAGEIFSTLTCGSMQGLRTDFDEQGQGVLLGIRGDEREVPVGGMSDGTADQLYLALRLALLERFVSNHRPLPIIVDDILINFDDSRTAAALEVFVQLARKTQVIFLTHHRRVSEIARANLGKEVNTIDLQAISNGD